MTGRNDQSTSVPDRFEAFWGRLPERLRMWSPWWLRHVLAVEREMHGRTMREFSRTEDALHATLVCINAHDRWCGHNPNAPGDPIINEAPRKARIALMHEEPS